MACIDTLTTTTSPVLPTMNNINMTNVGYKSVGYFTNWSIYGRNFFPWNVPADKLTHILYSFGDNRADGEVFLTDKWADLDIHWTDRGDSWSDTGNNMYGCLKQFNVLKKKNRNLKIMLSIGGWTYTQIQKHLDAPAATPEGRKKFANSCVTLIKDLGFDGIDLDWEYPSTPEQGQQLLLLLKEVRSALDAYANVLGKRYGEKPHFQLTIAAPAGAAKYANYPLKEIASTLDFINLMAYDYAGSWDTTSSHQANLYQASKGTPFNTKSVIAAYIAAGVPSQKIVLGQPLYGRAFQHTTGIGQPFSGVGEPNQAEFSWESGVWDFKALPRKGAIERIDEQAGASYSFNAATGELISYDNMGMAVRKAQYIKQNRLGGAMWWELSGDRPQGAGSLVQTVVGELGKLEQVPNWLRYPDSQYKNLAAGFT